MLSVALCLSLLATPVVPANLASALAGLPAGGVLTLAPGDVAGSVNIPADGVTLQGSGGTRLRGAVRVGAHRGVTLRGLSLEPGDDTAVDGAQAEGLTVDSCRIAGARIGVALGKGGVVTGCTFSGITQTAIEVGTDGVRVEDNLLIDCGRGRDGAGITLRGGKGALVRGNWLVRSALVVGAVGEATLEANALSGAGIEVGPGAKGVQLALNTIYDAPQAVTLRDGTDNRLLGNWLLDGRFLFGQAVGHEGMGLVLAEHVAGGSADNMVAGNLFQVSGPAVVAQSDSPPTPRKPADPCPLLRRNRFSGNLYDRADSQSTLPVGMLLEGTGRPVPVPTLAAYDQRGLLAQSDPGDLGLLPRWLWITAGDKPALLPSLYDPSCEAPSVRDGVPVGWTPAGGQTSLSTDGDARDGRCALQVVGRGDEPAPIGWRSQRLPVLPGATYGLAAWLRTDDVQPMTDDGGVVVTARWLSVTGEVLGRVVLLGPGELPLLRRGTQPWTDLSSEQSAPEQAAWLEVFAGLDHAKGNVRFDAVSIEQTQPSAPTLTRLPWLAKPGDPPPPPKPKRMQPWRPGWGKVN